MSDFKVGMYTVPDQPLGMRTGVDDDTQINR